MNVTEARVLAVIAALIERDGWPPTVREIGSVTGIRGTAPVHRCLARLTEQGWIERGRGPRQIRLTLAGKMEAARLAAGGGGHDTLMG